MSRALRVVAAVAILASGCASRGAVTRLRDDVSRLRAEVETSRASQEATWREVAKATADVRALDARLGELRTRAAAAAEDIGRLEGRLAVAEEAIGQTRAALASLEKAQAERPAPGASAAAPAPTPALAPREMPAARRDSPEQLYAAALAMFRAREHGQAVLDFIDFIARYPKHQLAGNAQYWIGEAYYVQRDFRQALVEFQKVLELSLSKVPDALVKIGLCHAQLRDPARARQAWERVVREYPTADAARVARSLLVAHASRSDR